MERYFGPLVFTSIIIYSCYNSKRKSKIITSTPGYCKNCSCERCNNVALSKSNALVKPAECHSSNEDSIKYGSILGNKRQISISSKSTSVSGAATNSASPLYRKHPRVNSDNTNNNNSDHHDEDINESAKAKDDAFEVNFNLKLMESSILKSFYKLVLIRGIPQNPTFDIQKFEILLDTFETRQSDVFVATYVKAGTTWTQQIIHSLLREGYASSSSSVSNDVAANKQYGESYGETVPWLEACASEMLQPREMPTWSLDKVNQVDVSQPRYFKTHATVDHLPGGKYNSGLNANKKFKVICVARNPKDTLVSLYFHAKSKPEFGYTGDMALFLEIFLSGFAENGCWFKHVLDWYQQCQTYPDTHLFLKYEDMCNDLQLAVRRIATFLQLPFPLTDELINKVVKQSSLNEMRESAGANIGLNHLRQGGYGGWRKHFTVQMNELFDRVYKVKMNERHNITTTSTSDNTTSKAAAADLDTVAKKNSTTDLKFNFGPNANGVDIIM